MAQPLVNEVHHWWPKTVSKYWANAEGCVHRLTPKGGSPTVAPPKNFGGIKNDNNIRIAATPTNWDQSFEQAFDKADSSFSGLIDWLLTIKPTVPPHAPLMMRLEPLPLSDEQHETLSECLASLIVRSPNFRHQVQLTIEGMRGRIGITPEANASLIGLNVRHTQSMLSACFARRGKFVLLRSTSGEFIFGDGFYHNVSSAVNEPYAPRCIVPLTPDIAVFYTAPTSYLAYPKFFTVNFSADEVAFINQCVQIYSRDEIFYRDITPVIDPDFTRGEFRQFNLDQVPGLPELQKLVANGDYGPQKNFQPSGTASGKAL